MYHSVTFGDKNTWNDWHLVPASRPLFNPPKQKRKTLEIPGGDGLIDLSESLTGYPVYGNREGSMEFIVMNGYKSWQVAYSDILDYLHGQTMKAVLEDDPGYYYEGRFSVSEWKSLKDWSRIVIEYSVGPYKWATQSSLDEWRWDPFSFETGVIRAPMFKNISVSTTWGAHTFSQKLLGRAPVCPSLAVTTSAHQGIRAQFVNEKLGINLTRQIPDGTVQIPDFIFWGDSVTLYLQCASGTGTVSIDFREGRL